MSNKNRNIIRPASDFNRIKSSKAPTIAGQATVTLPISKVIWNNELSVNFPAQSRLIEDAFRKAQVLTILNGEEYEDYTIDHPEPLFYYGLEDTVEQEVGEPVTVYVQPNIDPKKSAAPEDISVLKLRPEYMEKLKEFNDYRGIWVKDKKDHDKKVLRANEVFDEVFGPRAQLTMLETRRALGMAAAWVFLVDRYTPDDTHLAMSLVRNKWEALRKRPDTSMMDYFADFRALIQELKDVKRPPDNLECFDRLKIALLFDDVNYEKLWSHVITDYTRTANLTDLRFIDGLEKKLINKDVSTVLERKVQANNGTFSSMQKKEREKERAAGNTEKKPHKRETAEPEVAMIAEVAPSKQKNRNQDKNTAKDVNTAKAVIKNVVKPLAVAAAASVSNPKATPAASTTKPTTPENQRRCFICLKFGHIAANCPGETANQCEEFEEFEGDGVECEYCNIAFEELKKAAPAVPPQYLDSACSSTMSPPTPELTDFVPKTEKILLGGKGHAITSEGRGTMGELRNVMISRDLRHTLVSVPALDRESKFTLFGDGKAYVFDEKPIITGTVSMSATLQSNNMYQVDTPSSASPRCCRPPQR